MIEIRKAEREDIPLILEFIKKLAIFEREPDAAKATAEDLLRDGFGESPKFHVLIADWQRTPAGFAFYFYSYSTWQGKPVLYLEDLFVDDKFRGHSIGKSLLRHLAQIAVDNNCQRMHWQCLDWNQKSIDFYHSIGAKALKEWVPFRLCGASLESFARGE